MKTRIETVMPLFIVIPMLGLPGTFSVNVNIPDYWGIGKSVSRGFRTVIRTDNRRQRTDNREQI